MDKPNPYEKVRHYAQPTSTGMTALCYPSRRKINLRVASWTIREDAVTCPTCQEMVAELIALHAAQTAPAGAGETI